MKVSILLDTKHQDKRVTTVEVSGKRLSLGFLTKTPAFNDYCLLNKGVCSYSERFIGKADEVSLVFTSHDWDSVFNGLKDTVNTNPSEREIVRAIRKEIESSVPYESEYHFPEISRSEVETYIEKGKGVVSGNLLTTYQFLARASGNLIQFPNQHGLSLSKLSSKIYTSFRHYNTFGCFEHSYVFENCVEGVFPLNIGSSMFENLIAKGDVALNIVEWFRRAKEFPTKDDLLVQIGCHYEEMGEFCSAADTKPKSEVASLMYNESAIWKSRLTEERLEAILNDKERKREVVDALADTVVTAIGVLYELTGDPIGVLAEVSRSNWSKFRNGVPVFDENGKIKKGEHYSEPNLDRFI